MSSQQTQEPLKPSEVDEVGRFDQFATKVSNWVAKAWFFFACVVIVVLWAPSYFLLKDINTWQLIINTLTTIITFLLVALLQNTQSRDSKAAQRKDNAMIEALIDIMEAHQEKDSTMREDIAELRAAVGLEHREGS